eukprot:350680_1
MCDKSESIINRLIREDMIRASLYSSGVRYFYWEFYRHNDNEKYHVRGRKTYEENIGYKLNDWFIAAKYNNLKDELTNNLICQFSINQFQTTFIKASQKLDALIKDPTVKDIKCDRSWWEKTYGIKKNEPIKLEHIVSVLCYCNFSAQCYSFGETFRKLHKYESDEDMKKRHREYAIWGRLVRETVECFGIEMGESNIPYFYHGVS